MFNVTVINIKDSVKRISILILILVIIFAITKMVGALKTNKILEINISEKLLTCLNNEIPAMSGTFKKSSTTIKEDGEEIEDSLIARILGIELSQIKEVETITNSEEIQLAPAGDSNLEEDNINAKTNTSDVSSEIATNVTTQIVTQNPIKESFNIEIEGVKIKNETSFEINNSILSNQLDINKDNVIIFHTHTCESYTPSELYPYQ